MGGGISFLGVAPAAPCAVPGSRGSRLLALAFRADADRACVRRSLLSIAMDLVHCGSAFADLMGSRGEAHIGGLVDSHETMGELEHVIPQRNDDELRSLSLGLNVVGDDRDVLEIQSGVNFVLSHQLCPRA